MFVFIYILSLDWIVLFLRPDLEDTIELVGCLMLHFFFAVCCCYASLFGCCVVGQQSLLELVNVSLNILTPKITEACHSKSHRSYRKGHHNHHPFYLRHLAYLHTVEHNSDGSSNNLALHCRHPQKKIPSFRRHPTYRM